MIDLTVHTPPQTCSNLLMMKHVRLASGWLVSYLNAFLLKNTFIHYSIPVDNVNWLHFYIDIHTIYEGLIADGHIARDYLDRADWIGSIVGGVESWGASTVTTDVRNYRLIAA